MNVSVFGASNIGKVRELNEDSFGIYGFDEKEPFGFCIVADGMGGHQAGEVASNTTVELLNKYFSDIFSDIEKFDEKGFTDTINGAFDYANYEIYKMSVNNHGQHGMGTTTVATFVCGIDMWIANVGDSRAYIVRDGEIFQITKDHSVVAEMLERGSITKEEAEMHPNRNIITRAMGTEKYVDTDIFRLSARIGDKIILCSDGLSGMVSNSQMLGIIQNAESVEECINVLIEKANENGGRDNITVVGIYFNEAGEEI